MFKACLSKFQLPIVFKQLETIVLQHVMYQFPQHALRRRRSQNVDSRGLGQKLDRVDPG